MRDDDQAMLPKRRRAPTYLPADVPLPRVGEIVYLSSTSAWRVSTIVHEWLSTHDLRIEIWLDYVGGARAGRVPGFELTH